MDTNTDRVAAVRDLFPTNGPHSPEQIIEAAAVIAELWRYLGHAFRPQAGRIEPLENLSNAYSLVAELALADHRSVDILNRLAHWATYVGDRSTYSRDYGISDPDGSPDQIQSLMTRVAGLFQDSAGAHEIASGYLHRVHNQLAFVYTDAVDD